MKKPTSRPRQTAKRPSSKLGGAVVKQSSKPGGTAKRPSSKPGETVKRPLPRPMEAMGRPSPPPPQAPEPDGLQLEGKNSVWEALKAERQMERLYIDDSVDQGGIRALLGAARRLGVRVEFVPKVRLDALSQTGRHQGMVAVLPAAEYVPLMEIIDQAFEKRSDPLFVLLDEMQDPHNVGAIIRTAECAGAAGVVMTEYRSAGLTSTVARASAGAAMHMPLARVSNLVHAMDALKQRGVWVWGADMGGQSCWGVDLKGPLALVIGGEGKGLRRLVAQHCDGLAAIPMAGKTASLNASVAAGVLLFEALRQRGGPG